MAGDVERIVAVNEATAREVNEAIERGQWPGEHDRRTAYRCECARADCNRLVRLTPQEYEGVRAHGRRFVLQPGHERPDVERVVQRAAGYVVVAKRGPAGSIADRTDPRG